MELEKEHGDIIKFIENFYKEHGRFPIRKEISKVVKI